MNLKITANVKSAVRGLKKVSKESKKTDASIGKMAKGLGLLGAAIAGLGLAVAIKTIKTAGVELAILGDRLAKQAKMVGVTAEQYQGFEFAAKRSGTSITAVANGLKKLGRVMVDSRNGSRQMKETFAALDIELMKSDGTLRDVNDVFLDFAERSREMGASAERTGVTMLLLGRSGTELTNMMSQGSKGITDMKDVLGELGAVMSEDMLRDSESLVDAQADLEHAFRGVKIKVGEELIPVLTEGAEEISKFLSRMDPQVLADFAIGTVNLATNIALLVDKMFDLGLAQDRGMGNAEAALRGQSRATEELIGRLKSGKVDAYDFALAIGSDVEIGVTKGKDALWAYGQQLESSGVMGATAGQALVGLQASTAGLTDEVIAGAREYKELGFSALELNQTLVTQHGVTNEQVIALGLLFDAEEKLSSVEGDLSEMYKKRVADQKAAGEQARKDAEARGLEIRRAISGMEAKRKGEKAAADAARAHTKAIQDQVKWLKIQQDALAASQDEIYDLFYKSAESELMVKWSREHDAISNALQVQGDLYTTALADRQAADKRYSDGKLALVRARIEEESELEQESTESQLNQASAVFSATSTLFGALSSLAQQAYEEGDEKAKAHAIALFHVSQAAALATAAVSTALSVSQALATPPAPNIPLGVAAGIAGAAQIATIVGTSIKGIGDAGITSDMLRSAGLNNHSAIVMRNDETLLDPVGTKHITEMLAMQKNQMQGGGGDQTIRTTVEIDGRVLGESVDTYMIRQRERGLQYSDRIRQEYV